MSSNLQLENRGSEGKTLLGLLGGSQSSLPTLSVPSVLFQAPHGKP